MTRQKSSTWITIHVYLRRGAQRGGRTAGAHASDEPRTPTRAAAAATVATHHKTFMRSARYVSEKFLNTCIFYGCQAWGRGDMQ